MLNKPQSIELGKRLADNRKKKGLTQREVADLLELTQTKVAIMEMGEPRYRETHERVAIKPFADLYDVSEDELLDGIYDITDEKQDIVKELTNEISRLKAENLRLETRANMWQSRVEEIKAEQQNDTKYIAPKEELIEQQANEIERLTDTIKKLVSDIDRLRENQKTPMEKLVLKMLEEKYA